MALCATFENVRYYEKGQKRNISQNIQRWSESRICSASADIQQDKKLTVTENGGISAAVLTAIAIPVFTSQLEKSREATDAANIRSAYAVVQAAALIQDDATEFAKNDNANAKFTTSGSAADGDLKYTATVTLKQTQADWQSAPLDIGGYTVTASEGTAKCVIEWDQSTNATTFTFT